jgi:hypothetical protein
MTDHAKALADVLRRVISVSDRQTYEYDLARAALRAHETDWGAFCKETEAELREILASECFGRDGMRPETPQGIRDGRNFVVTAQAAIAAMRHVLSRAPQPDTRLLGYENVYRNEDGTLELGACDIDKEPPEIHASGFFEFIGHCEIRLISKDSGKDVHRAPQPLSDKAGGQPV